MARPFTWCLPRRCWPVRQASPVHPVIVRARSRLVIALVLLAVAAPAALVAAQYPAYWRWVALELTPMTWLQTVILVLAGAASALIAVLGRALQWPRIHRVAHWVLAFGFGYLALDDRFAIHERIRDRILAPRDVRLPGLDFLAPGDFQVLLMGVAGLALLPVVVRALRADRLALRLFALGVLCSVSAIAMDAIDPATMPLDVERLAQTLEECVELLAGCFYLAALGVRLLGVIGLALVPEPVGVSDAGSEQGSVPGRAAEPASSSQLASPQSAEPAGIPEPTSPQSAEPTSPRSAEPTSPQSAEPGRAAVSELAAVSAPQ